jgi:hypothetical protein
VDPLDDIVEDSQVPDFLLRRRLDGSEQTSHQHERHEWGGDEQNQSAGTSRHTDHYQSESRVSPLVIDVGSRRWAFGLPAQLSRRAKPN